MVLAGAVSGETAPSFTAAPLSSQVVEGEGSSWGLFYKGSNAIHEGFTLVTYAPAKGPTSKYHRLEG